MIDPRKRLEIDTCEVCGAEHDGPCPFASTEVCPECGEVECVCDFDPDFVGDLFGDESEWL